jgi:hypothetical protein
MAVFGRETGEPDGRCNAARTRPVSAAGAARYGDLAITGRSGPRRRGRGAAPRSGRLRPCNVRAEARLRTVVSRAYTNLGDLDRAAVELGTAIELAQRSDDLLYIAKLVDE